MRLVVGWVSLSWHRSTLTNVQLAAATLHIRRVLRGSLVVPPLVPRLSSDKKILTGDQLLHLVRKLPRSLWCAHEWTLLYSSLVHDLSLST